MRNFLAFSTILCILSGVLGVLQAEEIDHNGEQVDIDDPQICFLCHDDIKDHTHPVITAYPPAGRENSYASPDVLARAGVILLNDHVVCISCHDLSNQALNHPIKYVGGSELCLVCHII